MPQTEFAEPANHNSAELRCPPLGRASSPAKAPVHHGPCAETRGYGLRRTAVGTFLPSRRLTPTSHSDDLRSLLKRRLPNFRRHRRKACAFAANAWRNAAPGTCANAYCARRQPPQGTQQRARGRAMARVPAPPQMAQREATGPQTAVALAGCGSEPAG